MASKENNNSDNGKNRDKDSSPQFQPQYTSGMTPSIITTINNTSPTPIITNQVGDIDNRETRADTNGPKGSRNVEPPPYYESYIEDSFVGHWEREDDDPEYDYQVHRGSSDRNRQPEEEDESIHPSTIEFDFDSFGPESFIYTPAATTGSSIAAKPTSQSDASELPKGASDGSIEKILSDQQPSTSPSHSPASVIEQKQEDATAASAAPPEPPSKPDNPTRVCELKPSPVDYLVDPALIDLKVIEPYKKVISHAGYCHHFDPSVAPPKPGEPAPAIIVFSACYLPDRSRRDYDYVMDHLFLYVLSSLHELIADDYILIYLHNTQPSTTNSSNQSMGASSSSSTANGSSTCSTNGQDDLHRNNLPTFTWVKRCYQMIDRKLRKNLKILYLVKPTFWLKTIVIMCRPFISSKFSKKLRFIENMDALKKCIPVDQLILPASADCLL